uniref:Galectin n=1 Tax=Meloidogyne hapla TaxID=6305 RepID=A0A1I8AYP3_MELHA
MKDFGKLTCFEGKVPSASDMIGHRSFEVLLLHDTSEVDAYYGDILFKLNFTFDETLKMNAGFTSQAFLRVERYTRHSEFRTQEWYKNPIGQTGVPIVVLIYADKDFFRIIINEGADHIILNYDTLPPWAANYVMITGNIYDIAFDDDEKNTTRCQNLFNKYNISGLPSNIFTFDERLKIGGKIIIDGRIPVGFNETIEINFLHGAIKQHEHSFIRFNLY